MRPILQDYRREIRRRVIVGMSGLFVMFMLVLLAGLLTGQARREAEIAKAQAEAVGVTNPGGAALGQANEPLANLGVAPALDGGETVVPAPPAVAPAPGVGRSTGVVPDLTPDPKLSTTRPKN